MARTPTTHQNAHDHNLTHRYEVRRTREPGLRGADRRPVVERYFGLDRARIAALGYALDGPTSSGERFTGEVTVVRVIHIGGQPNREEVVDQLDERVAFRVLNELRLPRANKMAVGLDRIQAEADAMTRLGE